MRYGKILKIEEVFGLSLGNDYQSYEGYEVTTEETQVLVVVSDMQSCCESFGYISTPDEFEDFIGLDLLNVSIVDKALEKKDIPALFEGEALFVNLETVDGVLQLAVYNSHNGYYGHTAKVLIGNEILEETIL